MAFALAGTALAQTDVAATARPSIATRLKNGLRAGIPDRGSVRITEVQLYDSTLKMSTAEIDRRLQEDQWLPIGILQTRADGRLRITCHLDQCVAEAGAIKLHIQLLDKPPQEPPPRRGHR